MGRLLTMYEDNSTAGVEEAHGHCCAALGTAYVFAVALTQ